MTSNRTMPHGVSPCGSWEIFKQAKPHSTTSHTPNKLTPPFKKVRNFLKTWKRITSSHATCKGRPKFVRWTPRCSLNFLPGCNQAFAVAPLSHFVDCGARNVSSTSLIPRVPFLPLSPTDEALKSTLLSLFFSPHSKHTPSPCSIEKSNKAITQITLCELFKKQGPWGIQNKASVSFHNLTHSFSVFWFLGWVPESANPANLNLGLWLLNLKQAAKQTTPSLTPSKTPQALLSS